MSITTLRYLEQLTEADLELLAQSDPELGVTPADAPAQFRSDPTLVDAALRSPAAFSGLFESDENDLDYRASPFLVFAVAVHRGVEDLSTTSFVEERFARTRIPIFDADRLLRFVVDPTHRLFVVEHLASYTRVVSGPIWYRRAGRWRRQRYSELDPQRLAAALDVMEPDERAGVYRRLGDLALFLTGVFPDHTARRAPHPIEVERLLRSLRPLRIPARSIDVDELLGDHGSTGFFSWLGPHWYRLAADIAPLPSIAELLGDVAEHFDDARRFLNLVTDRYLFPYRERWFKP